MGAENPQRGGPGAQLMPERAALGPYDVKKTCLKIKKPWDKF